jgi:hypothetical protein
MSRRVLTIAALALVLLVAVANAQAAPSTANLTRCSTNDDCASATCCDVTVCVNKEFAPTDNTCKTVPCLQTPGAVTSCQCSSGFCQTLSQSIIVAQPATNAPGVDAPGNVPAPVQNQPADQLLQCSTDADCGMQTCCESKLCLNMQYAAQCGNLTAQFCAKDQLNCQCMSGRCGRGATAAPATTSGSPSSTSSQVGLNTNSSNVNVNNGNSGASAVSLLVVSALAALALAASQVA